MSGNSDSIFWINLHELQKKGKYNVREKMMSPRAQHPEISLLGAVLPGYFATIGSLRSRNHAFGCKTKYSIAGGRAAFPE
jgi:hypothetical protein